MGLVRITLMVLRLCVVVALVLGVLLWTGNFDSIKPVHILVGILIVLSLWLLGLFQFMGGGSPNLAAAAFVLGAAVAALGVTQESLLPGSAHWVIQVIHLLLGVSAAGLGEACAGRYKRAKAKQKAQMA